MQILVRPHRKLSANKSSKPARLSRIWSGLLLLGEVSPADVLSDDLGDETNMIRDCRLVEGIQGKACALHRFEPVAAIDEHAATIDENVILSPFALMSFASSVSSSSDIGGKQSAAGWTLNFVRQTIASMRSRKNERLNQT